MVSQMIDSSIGGAVRFGSGQAFWRSQHFFWGTVVLPVVWWEWTTAAPRRRSEERANPLKIGLNFISRFWNMTQSTALSLQRLPAKR